MRREKLVHYCVEGVPQRVGECVWRGYVATYAKQFSGGNPEQDVISANFEIQPQWSTAGKTIATQLVGNFPVI